MKLYQLNIPTKIYYGRNILQEALKAQEGFLKGNILIVTTGRSLIRMGYLEMLEMLLKSCTAVKDIVIFDRISANPRLSEVREGIILGKEKRVDIVIGFGGGSAMDAAKAVAAGIGTDEDIEVFYDQGREPGEWTLPIVAIPTTAGTGSELSKAAIITDTVKRKKGGIRGQHLYPAVAIVDSAFTESVPFSITMETGFDVLAHAVESYVSKAASPFTRMQSEYVIQTVGTYLPELAGNLKNSVAREKMSFASMIMGMNLGNASTALPHRLQYPLGAHTDTSHGAGLAALFPAWIKYECFYSTDKMEKAAQLLTGKQITGEENVEEAFRSFAQELRLPLSLRELGVVESQLAVMASEVTGNIQNDPAAQEEDIILKIYKAAY